MTVTPGESIAALFQSTNILTVCLWTIGFVLFAVEYFQPMRGIAYFVGVLLMGAAFVTRMIYGSPGEAFVYVFFTSLLLFLVHIVALGTQKRDWLRVARLEKAGERRRRYGSLINSIGVANTPIDHTGNVTINDVNLVVYSEIPIPQGKKVRITKVTPDRIMVERADVNPDDSD